MNKLMTTGKIAKPNMDEERKWKVKDALNTVMRAEELKKDPQMRKDMKKMAREEAKKYGKMC